MHACTHLYLYILLSVLDLSDKNPLIPVNTIYAIIIIRYMLGLWYYIMIIGQIDDLHRSSFDVLWCYCMKRLMYYINFNVYMYFQHNNTNFPISTGIQEEGIYRLSGVKSKVQALLDKFMSGESNTRLLVPVEY